MKSNEIYIIKSNKILWNPGKTNEIQLNLINKI